MEKGTLQLLQLEAAGLEMVERMAKLAVSRSVTYPLHQVLTLLMKVVMFPIM